MSSYCSRNPDPFGPNVSLWFHAIVPFNTCIILVLALGPCLGHHDTKCLIIAADTDRSGFLDVEELSALLQQLFRDGVEKNLDPAIKMRIGEHVEASVKQLGKSFDSGE